ncbi:MAG: lysostaphin resistance A-like protein [Thermodesulfobacteriota bacterium]
MHFKKVRFSGEDTKEILTKIQQFKSYPEKEQRLQQLKLEFNEHKNLDKYTQEVQNIERDYVKESVYIYNYNARKIKIKYLANHYYLPMIVSETEKIDYLNYIINVPSEVRFIEQLEEYLANVIWGAILLASTCWAIAFGWISGNFWLKIGLSVMAVFLYSLIWQRPKIPLQLRSFLLGLLSAAILYLIFLLGHKIALHILSGSNALVEGIYSLGVGTNKALIFLLLFFLTGPIEEIFWRGFLQDRLMKRWGSLSGYLITNIVYAGVHVFFLNLVLIIAALVAGAFWGLLYLWKRDLLIQITSHSFWSAVIFVVARI